MNEREIFAAAMQLSSAEERAAYLQQACGDDGHLRVQVEALLAEQDKLGSFLEGPVALETLPTPASEIPERTATQIGPYKLLQVLGEGGMGVVYMAQQSQPVVRRVALKIIKPGMDTRQVIARFEAERQALALMDHPNIAKVLDAGATPSGRPYFVMELVKGVPITQYCDQQHLPPRARLELFILVCQAVQHAHQKGVIHRDLKPSNVLVAPYDDRPVPKIIDFGLAKATSQQLTAKTMFTEVGSIVGTLEYMAPEQARLNNLDIDTRADIYSLGVILYELLAGSPPFSAKQLRSAGLAEMLRMIREDEPQRPSTKISSSNELPSIAANRHLEPQRLTRMVRGDLDWIAMKCLEKPRERRYETANGLALDLERYLRDEPVLAGPPSSVYRLRKFFRRNKSTVLAATGMFLVLLAGLIGTGAALVAARSERNAKALALAQAEANFRQARDAVDQFLTEVGDSPDLKSRGLEPLRRRLLAKAQEFYENFVRQHAGDAALQADLALSYHRLAEINRRMGDLTAAEKLYDQARDRYADLQQAEPGKAEHRFRRSDVLNDVAFVYKDTDRRREAESTWRTALALREQLRKEFPGNQDYASAVAITQNNLGLLYHEASRFEEAIAEYRNALAIHEALYRAAPEDLLIMHRLAIIHYNLGKLYLETKQYPQSLPETEQAITLWRKAAAKDPADPEYVDNLAMAYINRGLYSHRTNHPHETREDWHQAIQWLEKLTREHPYVPAYLMNLATVRSNLSVLEMDAHRQGDALGHLRQASEALERLLQVNPSDSNYALWLGTSQVNLSAHFLGTNQLEQGLATCDKALLTLTRLAEKRPELGNVRELLRMAHTNRGNALSRLGRHDEALKSLDQAEAYDEAKSWVLAVNRAGALARRGDHVTGVALADRLLQDIAADNHHNRYELSVVYALASAAAANDPALAESDRGEKADDYAARAMQLIRDAQAAGYFKDPGKLLDLKTTEADLAPLRERPDFIQLIQTAEAEGK